MDKKELYKYIDENKGIFEELSDKIWSFAEISLKEHESARTYKALLEELGFKVETGLAGVETAFSGTYGSGKPVIGILGEYPHELIPGLLVEELMLLGDDYVIVRRAGVFCFSDAEIIKLVFNRHFVSPFSSWWG